MSCPLDSLTALTWKTLPSSEGVARWRARVRILIAGIAAAGGEQGMSSQLLDLVQVCEDAPYWSWRPGDRGRPLASFRESVAEHRRLVQEVPAKHDAELATALLGLSVCLAGLGRALEALAAAHEAVLIGHDLTAAGAGDCQPVLALAMASLSVRLRDMDQNERSLAAGEEAVEQCRPLINGDFPVLEHVLASALTGLCAHYSRTRQRERALAAAREAADTYERLAARSPAAIEADQAGSLNNLGAAIASLERPRDAVQQLQAAAGIYQRLTEAAPGTYEANYAVTLYNLSTALADRADWSAAIRVTEQAIQIQRELAVEEPAAELALARSLSRLALAYERTDNPVDAALAAATEATGIFQRLAAEFPEAAPLMRHAAQVLDDLLVARDRSLLPSERSWYHYGADGYIELTDKRARLMGITPLAGKLLTGTVVTGVQQSLRRIFAAAAIARSFLTGPGENPAEDLPDDAVGRARDNALRCLEVYLSTRRINGFCLRYLRYESPDPSPSSGDREPPPGAAEAIRQIELSAADAEKAFAALIDQFAGVIAGDDDLFAECVADLLDRFLPHDHEGWRLISVTLRKREPYSWIFTDERIEADVAALAFFEQYEDDATSTGDPADSKHWIDVALRHIYDKTAPS
jgi:tetratricopeptide (TPR) repeat protein